MDPSQAESVVRQVLQENIGDDVASQPLSSSLEDDLGFDELDFVETAMSVEKALARPGGDGYLVELQDEDMMGWKTMQDVVDTVVKITQPGYGRLPR